MNKHQAYDLKQMQSLPLDAKIRMTKERIRQWYEHWDGMVYVSFSGGKDSTVLKHIVDSMYDDVPAVFVNTGLEYPEIQKFAKSQKNVIVVRPEMRFDEVLKKYGYPVISKEVSKYIKEARNAIKKGNMDYYAIQKLQGRLLDKDGNKSIYNCEKWGFMIDAPYKISHQCCDVMKKKPVKAYEKESGRKPFIGTMASESFLRKEQWIRHGCNAFDKNRPSSQPLSFWTEQDILLYLKKYNVPYCSVYGDIVYTDSDGNEYATALVEDAPMKTTGCNRTGCIFCMFGCHLEKEPNRFQRLKETHPRQYEYCINGGEMVDGKWQPSKEGLGLGYVLDYIGVKYD
jgi:3'-phosphoadenosine 5'-phosphosulfate sulfotransferase (PAPS reductase)/FAD synthetase